MLKSPWELILTEPVPEVVEFRSPDWAEKNIASSRLVAPGFPRMRENMLGYLFADIICSEKRTVFRERSSRKTVSYEEQIMSKNKYPSIFSPQMATIVFIILQIFFATREVLKIGEYSRIFPSFSCGIFGHVTRLGQSRVSKKI